MTNIYFYDFYDFFAWLMLPLETKTFCGSNCQNNEKSHEQKTRVSTKRKVSHTFFKQAIVLMLSHQPTAHVKLWIFRGHVVNSLRVRETQNSE